MKTIARRKLPLLVVFGLLCAGAVALVVTDAEAQEFSGKGWTVEWQGKRTNYAYSDQWRGNYTQANFVMFNDKTKATVTYYGNFVVFERDR